MMVPRTAMVTASISATLDEVIETCWRNGVTRVPVHGDTRDDVRGIADVRDALRARAEGSNLTDVLSEPRFVPGSKPVDEILTEMQREGHRMVIVVDEFGTVIGLATLEDVVEEVVGEIFGRGETDPIREVDADTAVVNGWATVEYVNERLGLDLQTEGPFETIAGLVNYHTGRLATEGERVELGDITITVVDATERRVRRVRIDWMGDGDPQAAETADGAARSHARTDGEIDTWSQSDSDAGTSNDRS